jgi:3-hydroxybutyryl-CoA dehydrogenase
MQMSVQRVGVVGCGLIGAGISEVCARYGYQVVIREVGAEHLARGLERVERSMQRGVERGKLTTADAEAARGRISGTLKFEDLADVDLVIEAVPEDMTLKQRVFRELDEWCAPRAVLTSATSSLPITPMATVTSRPSQVLGTKFYNPAPVMQLVEVVRTPHTSEETLAIGRQFVESLEKTVVVCQDRPGFIVEPLILPFLLDAVRTLEQGIADTEDIDKAVMLGLGHPMGPLALLDFVGIDTAYQVAVAMHQEYDDPRFAPPPLMKQMVAAGLLGRKTGRGFHNYS